MNQKITKLRTERSKNSEKISELQARNKEIDGQIAELENTAIVGLVRSSGLTPDKLAELIRAMREKPLPIDIGNHEETEETNEKN
jgi:septal ring factor EnvC (AmiA/AmiB activator)